MAWCLKEPEEEDQPIHFHMGEEDLAWWDIFCRPSDRLVIEAESLKVDGEESEVGTVTIREEVIGRGQARSAGGNGPNWTISPQLHHRPIPAWLIH